VATLLLVSHTHWDREWYRTYEAFRARLVDTVDRVLDLLDADPGWEFLLDGQSIVIEDYLEVRPEERARLEAAVRAGRLAVGPWYVQPDSLLPSGEAHVRNLLEGRRVATATGGCSRVAYTPDSFGHPAQLPQLFAGFGLDPFVYWRGNGAELDELGPLYRWVAPDGSGVTAYHLGCGYFAVACLDRDPEVAARGVAGVVEKLRDAEPAPLVLMNGIDHMLPDAHTAAVADALARLTGEPVRRGVLDDLVGALPTDGLAEHRGELTGGRVANLLPGVWSARLPLKLANRAAERALEGWAEPWAVLGRALGTPDEQPSVRRAWRALLPNQAHDSICGCSQDRVHEQMRARYDTARELADETTARVLERLAGLGPERRVPWGSELDVAVFNPSPRPRTDVVTVRLDGYPVYAISDISGDIHPLTMVGALVTGYQADGAPARVVPSTDVGRVRMLTDFPALDVELVARDVPAFGWTRVHLAPGPERPDQVDDGRVIEAGTVGGPVRVEVADDGTLTVTMHGRSWAGLAAVEECGDRGDTYDFDPVPDDPGAELIEVDVTRSVHPAGIACLRVRRDYLVPAGLDDAHARRVDERVPMRVVTDVRLADGVDRVDLKVRVESGARDHRVRLAFPSGAGVEQFLAATTFDVAERRPGPADATGWVHPAPATFCHQGWVHAHDLTVAAPGLPEAEVGPDGTIALTLLRAVGWLSRVELTTRPIPAGPGLATPGAQCPEGIEATLSLTAGPPDPQALAAAELGLRAVPAGDTPLLEPGVPLLALAPDGLVLSAMKPAESGAGAVVRVLNPTGEPLDADLSFGVPVRAAASVRLDETPDGGAVTLAGATVRLTVGPHALRSVLVRS
jgi:alpha-mannosidase